MANKFLCKSTYKTGVLNYLNLNKIKVGNTFNFCIKFLEPIYPNLHDKKSNWNRVAELVQNNWPEFKKYVKNAKKNQNSIREKPDQASQ